jgi:cellulose synthase (UDP-forming)
VSTGTGTLAGSRKQPGRHRSGTVVPLPPDDNEKVSYVDRHLLYLILIIAIGSASAIGSQAAMEVHYSLWLIMPYTACSTFYVILSLAANFTGRNFDYAAHRARVESWRRPSYPEVDIHLPICGEPISILRNTWIHVFELVQAYPGTARAHVLDDGNDAQARELAASFGYNYIVRENRPWMKKAGNLRNAFAQTRGEFIVILDADFAPRPDLLAETLPYFDDPQISIVQTPQFFRPDRRQTWVERAAGAVQEIFYRSMQVSRDSHGASICVGTCAVYRRQALEANGGTTAIEHSEDVHTGFDLRMQGWNLRYIPVPLAAGVCPDDSESFLTQQYRWCAGSMSLLTSRKFWAAKMPWTARACYMSGFCYYMYTAVAMLVSPLIPSVLLILIPGRIEPQDYLSLLPAIINGMILYPLWHRCRYGPSTWPLAIVRGWAHALALWDTATGRRLGWQATGGKGRKSRTTRFWVGVIAWNGGAAAAWLGLAAWRMSHYGPGRLWIISAFGVLYAAIIVWIILSSRESA